LALARTLQSRKRLSEAIDQYRALIEAGAGDAVVHNNLANCLSLLGRAADALPHYRRVAELDPAWPHAAGSVLGALNFDPHATPDEIFEAHRAWGERVAQRTPKSVARANREAHRRIRVGYVSPDLKRHPVTYLFAPTLEHHDRSRFEIFCYDNLGVADVVTERLRRSSDAWREVAGLSDEAFCDQVRADAIDILVDLAGHTTHSRLAAFAMKPAPVQVSWLGYFNTTGLPAMDCFISDPHSSPEGQERWFVERLVRLPHTRFCYEPPGFAPAVAPLPARDKGRITFGCFNNLSKVNERVMALWSRVLDAVPGSRLRIIAIGLHDTRNVEHVRKRFERRGIVGDRLELSPFLPHDQLLAAYSEIDVALDPFPFAGGMTSLEALWMGVPVVTLASPMLAGRQTLCFLRNVGLDAFVADSEDAYVTAAVEAVRDLDELAAFRTNLRERMRTSPLMDATAFTRDLERAYEAMFVRS
jgi:predicted O-linked N-acetylglucosamine transferase (SPINDLY family)